MTTRLKRGAINPTTSKIFWGYRHDGVEIAARKKLLASAPTAKSVRNKRLSGWRKDNKFKLREYFKEYNQARKTVDPLFQLTSNTRSRFSVVLKKKKFLKTSSVGNLLGCSYDELKTHLERRWHQCPLTGQPMSWANHGKGKGKWNIDHIVPLAIATTSSAHNALWNYTNLQPLWFEENASKSSRHDGILHKRNL